MMELLKRQLLNHNLFLLNTSSLIILLSIGIIVRIDTAIFGTQFFAIPHLFQNSIHWYF
jgi:hypothetical protein